MTEPTYTYTIRNLDETGQATGHSMESERNSLEQVGQGIQAWIEAHEPSNPVIDVTIYRDEER